MIERETSGRDGDEDRVALDSAIYGSPQTDEMYEPSLETNVRCPPAPALGGSNQDNAVQEVALAAMRNDDNDNAFVDVNDDIHNADEPRAQGEEKAEKETTCCSCGCFHPGYGCG